MIDGDDVAARLQVTDGRWVVWKRANDNRIREGTM
jgi:hypothetical protein